MLVLLIIFLVVTPLMSKTFWVHLPKFQPADETSAAETGAPASSTPASPETAP